MAVDLDLSRIPEEPGVYLWKDGEGVVLYVGKAGNLRARLGSYRSGETDPRKVRMLERAEDVELMLTGSEKEALILESSLIKRHKPRYNVRLTDDKRYPYIQLTRHPYPRVRIARDTRGPGQFFGPFPDTGAARRTLQVIREVYKLRDCKELIPGGCLNYQLDLCWAPCIMDHHERLRKAPRESLALVDVDGEYARSAKEAAAFLRGDSARLARELTLEMERAAEGMEFERAAVLRDRLQAITTTLEKQAIFSRSREDRDAFVVARKGGLAVGVVVLMRKGQVVGQEHFFFRRGSGDATEADLLAEFVARYYENLPGAPGEVVLPVDVPGAEGLREWLAERRGGPVDLTVPVRGEKRRALDLAQRNAEFKLGQELLRRGERDAEGELESLRAALRLPEAPRRIECFDISHLQGTGVVASMSVLVEGRPAPTEYRRFRLRVQQNDDFASMNEVVGRRYGRLLAEGGDLPGLVLIDGGRGQLKAAGRALMDLGLGNLPVAALAKREEEVFLPGRLHPVDLPKNAPALLVLIRARDEAHRFAVQYQRRTRAKAFTESALDAVEGLGPRKKRALLAHFGTVEAVAKADEAALAKVPGIGPGLAQRIHALRTRGDRTT